MADSSLTPQEFELHLRDLRDKLKAYLERGEGSLGQLRKEAEAVLALTHEFPVVWARYPEVEGMVADLLAREKQRQVFGTGQAREAPGCALAWLFRRRK
jgi:hypothetical protein